MAQALIDYEGFVYLATVSFLFMLLILAVSRLTSHWRLWAARFLLTTVLMIGLIEAYSMHREMIYPRDIRLLIRIAGLTTLCFSLVVVLEWCFRQLARFVARNG